VINATLTVTAIEKIKLDHVPIVAVDIVVFVKKKSK
jgi:hypothetical protein